MSLCILTDTTVLFPQTSPHGGRFVRFLNLKADANGLLLPDIQEYLQIYTELEHEFNAILVLAGSESIFPALETARQAAQSHGGSAKIEVLDTLQIGPGLGILAQLAARKAAAGSGLFEMQEYIRASLPYLFTIICPDILPLYPQENNNSQPGSPAEPAGTLSVYSLEEGQLSPYKKVRTQRHLLEIFQEFLEEFETPQQFVYFHGKNSNMHVRPLREAISSLFPGAHFTDLDLNENLTSMFGEHAVGLTVLELPREKSM